MRLEILGHHPLFPKYGKDVAKDDKIGQKSPQTSQGVAENVAGRRRERRRASQRTSQASQKTSQDVAGRRRASQGVAGASQARFWQKLSFSRLICPNWAKPWFEIVSDTLSRQKCRFIIELAFSAKHGGKPWFQQRGLCVFQRKLANKVHNLAFAHPTSKPKGCLHPEDPML